VRGVTITGVVHTSDGAPVAGAEVRLVSAGYGSPGPFAGRLVGAECPFRLPRAVSGTDGAFRLEHVPPGRVDLAVELRGARRLVCREQRELVDGAHELWDLELTTELSISGRALDRAGNALPKAQILVDPGAGARLLEADEGGRFVLSTPDPELRTTLELVVAGSVRARREGVRAGDEVELVADPASGALRGRFVDAGGRVRSGDRVRVHLRPDVERLVLPSAEVAADGAFTFPDLAPGRYRASFQCDGAEIARGEWIDVAGGETLDLGRFETRAPGALTVVFQTPAGERCSPQAWLKNLEDSGSRRLEQDGDRWRASDLEPGRYRLSASGLQLAPHQEELEIQSGLETHLSITLRPAVCRILTLTVPGGAAFERLEITVRDATTGETVAWESDLVEHLWLPMGRFELEATTDTGLRVSAVLEIPDLQTEVDSLSLELR